MKDPAPKNPGGRPRKPRAIKKSHRVQVAMSDGEKAAAGQLAELLNTSVSAAIAHAVVVALDVEQRRILTAAWTEQITAAAVRTAQERQPFALDESENLLVINYPAAAIAYANQSDVPLQRAYDDAIAKHSRAIVEGYAAAGMLSTGRPVLAEGTRVLFSFYDKSSPPELQHLRYYGEPLPWSAIYPQQTIPVVRE